MSKFKVKISNLSFDVEFEEIKDVVNIYTTSCS